MERLISIVQNNPVLYDTSHPEYMRTKVKDQIWEEIAKEINMGNGRKAKDQWTKLRDCHRDALRRQRKRRSESSAAPIRPWIYQKQMEFLLPFMTNRPLPLDDPEQQSSDQELSTGGHEGMTDEASNNTIDTQGFAPATKKKKSNMTDGMENDLMQYDQRATSRDELGQHEVVEENDALQQFFYSMFNLTKVMPMRYQQQIRRKLFAAVTEAEDEIYSQSSSFQPSFCSSSTSNIDWGDK